MEDETKPALELEMGLGMVIVLIQVCGGNNLQMGTDGLGTGCKEDGRYQKCTWMNWNVFIVQGKDWVSCTKGRKWLAAYLSVVSIR